MYIIQPRSLLANNYKKTFRDPICWIFYFVFLILITQKQIHYLIKQTIIGVENKNPTLGC